MPQPSRMNEVARTGTPRDRPRRAPRYARLPGRDQYHPSPALRRVTHGSRDRRRGAAPPGWVGRRGHTGPALPAHRLRESRPGGDDMRRRACRWLLRPRQTQDAASGRSVTITLQGQYESVITLERERPLREKAWRQCVWPLRHGRTRDQGVAGNLERAGVCSQRPPGGSQLVGAGSRRFHARKVGFGQDHIRVVPTAEKNRAGRIIETAVFLAEFLRGSGALQDSCLGLSPCRPTSEHHEGQ